jgi:AraC-like DNA-binding protein
LLDGLREAVGKRFLLETELTADEVGLLLGFSEAAAFHHSFKRWTGTTPRAFRKKAI